MKVDLQAPTRNLTDYRVHRRRIGGLPDRPANPNGSPRNPDLVLDHPRRLVTTESKIFVSQEISVSHIIGVFLIFINLFLFLKALARNIFRRRIPICEKKYFFQKETCPIKTVLSNKENYNKICLVVYENITVYQFHLYYYLYKY